MGLDGGTYATRSDVLRRNSWKCASADKTRSTRGGSVSTNSVYQDKQLNVTEQKLIAWTTCFLTGQPLVAPVVVDRLGHLYNREAVIELLLAKKGSFANAQRMHWYSNTLRVSGQLYDHMKTLKDVVTVQLTAHEDSSEGAAQQQSSHDSSVKWPYMCPVTVLPCGRFPFSALSGCGHVISDRAIAHAKGTCPVCSKKYAQHDVIPINGTQDQVEQLRKQLLDTAGSSSSSRPKKKQKMAAVEEIGAEQT